MSAEGGIPFGSYSLFRRLARGGMAEVFLARQRHLEGYDRRVAVKRILPHLSDSADFVRMFLGEARLAARLTHPNIVHIYDFGKVADEYYIAMEYVDGVHAGQLIKHAKTEPLPPVLIARIGADAAAALSYAHNFTDGDGKLLRLVHRDVSPPNLMVSYDGVVKLVDFGIAKATAVDSLTNPGTVKGKYAYMSPEQTTARTLDGRSDVFSLGLVLWELIAGRHIVERGNPVDAMRAIRDGKLPRIETVCPDVPRELSHALALALETDREDRASALELSQILEAYIKAAPELATSVQLAAWIRTRFAPNLTGAQPSLPESGTRVATSGSSAAQSVITPGGHGRGVDEGEADGDHLGDTMIDGGTVVGAKSTLSGDISAIGLIADTPAPVLIPPAGSARGKAGTRPPPLPASRRRPPSEDGADLDYDETIARGPAVRSTPVPAGDARPVKRTTPPPLAKSIVLDRPEDRPTAIDKAVHVPIGANTPAPTLIADARRTPVPPGGASDPTVIAAPIVPPRPSEPTIVAGAPPGAVAPRGSGPPRVPVPPFGSASPYARPAVATGTATDHLALPVHDIADVRDRTDRSERSDPTNVDRTSGPSLADRTAKRLERLAGTPRRRALLAAIAGGVFAAVIGVVCVTMRGGEHHAGAPAAGDAAGPVAVADAAPPPDAVPITTELRVVTTPPGAVAVVGDRRGQTPISFTLDPGTFAVHIDLAGHVAVDRTVVLAYGDHRILDLTLDAVPTPPPPDHDHGGHDTHRPTPAPGALTVWTTPYSDVYLGGRHLGQTPFADVSLPPGKHTLTFKHPGKKPFTRTVDITSGKTTKLNFKLP